MPKKSLSLTREQIQEVVEKSSSALEASKLLGVTYSSFLRYAKKFNLFFKNQGGRGISKGRGRRLHSIEDLLSNKVPCSSSKLKKRLYEVGLKKPICEACGQRDIWNKKPLSLHLDHIDGDSANNRLENLQILCPNCHTQTSTYCRGQWKGNLATLK